MVAAHRIFALVALGVAVAARGEDLRQFRFAPCADVERANLQMWMPAGPVEAVMVLCPGLNGSGEGMIRQKAWQAFAREHRLGLIGLSL